MTNVHLDQKSWMQACLPVDLGLGSAVDLAPCSFLSASNACHTLSDLLSKLSKHTAIIPVGEQPASRCVYSPGSQRDRGLVGVPSKDILELESSMQHIISRVIHLLQHNYLLDSASQRDRTQILATLSKLSGAWLNCTPVTSLGTRLTNDQTRIAVAIRLGSTVCEPHICLRCNTEAPSDGSHGLHCRCSAGWQLRHAHLNGIMQHALATAHLSSVLEPPGLLCTDNKRPDGMTLVLWTAGSSLVWDVSMVNPLAPSYLEESCTANATTANMDIVRRGYKFVPLAFETLSQQSLSTVYFVRKLGAAIHASTGEERSTSSLALSIAIQQHNAACVVGSLPTNENNLYIVYIY